RRLAECQACFSLRKLERRVRMPLGQNQGGGAGRRLAPGDICPTGIRTRRPQTLGRSLFPRRGEEATKAGSMAGFLFLFRSALFLQRLLGFLLLFLLLVHALGHGGLRWLCCRRRANVRR